jgi:acyl carrier protein
VRAWLREQLPPYMVPRLVIPVDALPLTPAGKVERAALPDAARAGRQLRTGYAPPRTEVEAYLAGVWGELLSIEPVGIHDDFFALGGHSLLAAELFTAVERGTGVDVPARTVYVQPTIAALAATIEATRARAGAAAVERG